MADKKADGPAKPGAPARVAASVNDAVRIATEASLTPPTRPYGRREAAALKASSPRMTVVAAAVAPELGSVAPVVTAGTPAATMLAATESEVPEPSLPEPATPSAGAESEVLEPSLPEPAPRSAAAESEPAAPDVVPEWIPSAAAAIQAEPADASPMVASAYATLAEPLPEPSPALTAEFADSAAPAAVAAVNVPTPTPPKTIRKMETIMTTAEDFMSFQQGNFEALVKSGQIWAAGLQDLSRHFAATAQAQMDETMGTVKAIVGVKSLREAVELQSTLARSSMEKAVTEGGKITDATMKLAEQTMAPITARLTLAAEKFGRTAA